MNYFKKLTFLHTSILIASLILTTVAAQFILNKRLENRAIDIEHFAIFISDVNAQIKAIDINSIINSSEKNNQNKHEQLIARIQNFTETNTIEIAGERFEVTDNLLRSIGRDTDTEKQLDELLSEFIYKLKMGNGTLPATIHQLSKKLSQSEKDFLQRIDTLRHYQKLSIFILFIALVVELLFIIVAMKKAFFDPLKKGVHYCDSLVEGKTNENSLPKWNGELGALFNKLNQTNQNISDTSKYLEELLKGNSEFQLDHDYSHNELVKNLKELSDRISKAKHEEEQANWLNLGLAKFADMLQNQNQDMEKFGDQLISELVKYTSVNQGAIFTLEETDNIKQLKLLSTYAWGKKRFSDREVTMDSGNLMVQALKEGDYIYLKEIPEDFINITSGLGDANPKAVLIVPLMINNEPLGVIEIATLNEFEDYKITFINKVCESIAQTFSNIANSINTKKLLEQSQAMTEQLRAQEEELRQNAEELEASRENIHRELEIAKNEMQDQVEQIESEKLKNIAILEGCVDGVVIFKEDGIVDFFNKSAEEIWSVSRDEIVGKSINNLLPIELVNDQNNSNIFYTGGGQYKKIDVRTEITSFDQAGNEISLLITSSHGNVKGAKTYAFFVQTITVELF